MKQTLITWSLVMCTPWVLADPAAVAAPGDTPALVAGEMARERIVKGAPYCADAVHEAVQAPSDGNRIVRRQTMRLCRDGEGRTRREVELDGRRTVYLHDPVARENWVLDPERRTARRGSASAPNPGPDGADWPVFGERMRERASGPADRARPGPGTVPPALPAPSGPAVPSAPSAPGTPPAMPAPGVAGAPPPPVPVPVPPAVSGTAARPAPPVPPAAGATLSSPASGGTQQELRGLRVDGARSPLPPLPPLPDLAAPPAVAGRAQAQAQAPRDPGVVQPLGTREIEGLRAYGERTTWTLQAGRVGREQPIVITREVWTVPELMLTVLSLDKDPRSGERSYRLQNLRRGEPDPALMQVPADYDQRRRLPAPPGPATRG